MKENVLVVLFFLLLFFVIPVTPFCDTSRVGVSYTYDSHSKEYLLVAPYRVNKSTDTVSDGTVYFMRRDGSVVHTWHTEAPVLLAKLEEDGSLFVSMTPPLNHAEEPGFGTTGIMQKLSWDGEVLWEHRDPKMTIGFDVLPDGSVAYMRWEKTPAWFSLSVDPNISQVWANELVVVNKEGQEQWVWKVSDHVSPTFPLSEVVPKTDFSHGNSVAYVAESSFGVPVFVMSFRHLSEVLVVDAVTGEVLWKSPEGMFSFQHDARLSKDGILSVFDNGFAREGIHALFSRVAFVDTKENALVRTYTGGNTLTGNAFFASSVMGSAQTLSNGNMLVTVSTTGHVYEVNKEGKVVWEYLYTKRDTDGEPRILFRVDEYSSAGTAWESKVLLSNTWASFCNAY